MALFKKKTKAGTALIPSYFASSASLLLLGFLFLLCFNQPEYAMSGGESDSLKTTIAFTVLLVVSVFLDIGLYYAIPEGNKPKGFVLLGNSLFVLIALIVGFASYYSVYNETVLQIRLSRLFVTILIVVLWLLGVLDKFLMFFKKPKNIAEIQHFIVLISFCLTMTVSYCFSVCVNLTMELVVGHYAFALLLVALFGQVASLVFFVFCLSSNALSLDKKSKISLCLTVSSLALAFLPLVGSLVAYELNRSISFRSFYWMLAGSIFAIACSVISILFCYFFQRPERLPELADEE